MLLGTPHGMEYPHIYEHTSPWDAPYYNQSPLPMHAQKGPHEDVHNNFWRLNESPATPAYSQAQFSVPQSAMSLPVASDGRNEIYDLPGSRNDHGWSPPPHPGRSMSLVQPEDVHQQYQNHLRENAPGLRRRKTTPSDVMTPSIHDTLLYTSAGPEPPQSAPLAGPYGVGQDTGMHFPYNSTWQPFHQPAHQIMGPPTDRSQGWFPKSPLQPHLAQVKEDEPSTSFRPLHAHPMHYDTIPGSAG